MSSIARVFVPCIISACLGGFAVSSTSRLLGSQPEKPMPDKPAQPTSAHAPLSLGNFSISLAVKDVATSKAFYEKLGMRMTGGNLAHKYVIMQNDTSTIGLYQGMFEKNSLTYNPGWDRDCKTLPAFADVRELQRELKARGLTITTPADDAGTGPAFITLVDPDGNPILIDQHTAKPKK